ncbi:hypothetical protein XENTR_v10007926 [Xenopus tropicalis]|nr:hypothetical protein XENTR_v10007926 [Xenopus tropicalis]
MGPKLDEPYILCVFNFHLPYLFLVSPFLPFSQMFLLEFDIHPPPEAILRPNNFLLLQSTFLDHLKKASITFFSSSSSPACMDGIFFYKT